jgi:hypothetical protein
MAARRSAKPVVEDVFTEELGLPQDIGVQTENAFFYGVRRAVRDARHGRRLTPHSSRSVEPPDDPNSTDSK